MDVLVMVGQLILALSILVLLHELGHMLPAKWFGMKVEKFYLFFDAWFALFKKKIGETEFGIGWLPLGGYVKISGMVDESMDVKNLSKEPEPWEFRAKPAWQRLIVMMGGITVNLILGIVIFIALVYVSGERYLPASEVKYGIVAHELAQEMGLRTGDKILKLNGKEIERFEEIMSSKAFMEVNSYYTIQRGDSIFDLPIPANMVDKLSSRRERAQFITPIAPFKVARLQGGFPAEKAGILPGDKITAIDSTPIAFFHELQAALADRKGKESSITIERNGEILNLKATITEDGKLGFIPELLLKEGTKQYGLFACIPVGTKMAFDVLYVNVLGFGKIFRGEVKASNAVSGPIAIAQDLYGGAFDWLNFWRNTALLSLVLAFMNFLPIPALDGGHVMFLLYEIIARRKPSQMVLEWGQRIGMIILLSIMVFAVFNDVIKRLL